MVTDQFAGLVGLDRHAVGRPGHVTGDGGELELSYVLRRRAWGAGLAFEATTAALRAAAGELPGQPVLVVIQTANQRARWLARRLGFQEVDAFEEYGAQQILAVAPLGSFQAPMTAERAALHQPAHAEAGHPASEPRPSDKSRVQTIAAY